VSDNLTIREVNGWPVGFREGNAEALVRDIDLGTKLRYPRPRKVRELIERMILSGQLVEVYVRPTVGRTSMPNGGFREETVLEYWLTEAQALKVAARSDTDIADELLNEMIAVYMAARRGELPQQISRRTPMTEMESHVRILALRQREALSLYTVIPGLFDQKFLTHLVEHAAALVIGQAPVIEDALLDVEGYLKVMGFSDAELNANSSRFGKRLKKLYVEQHGKEPGKQPRNVNGGSRRVFCYSEADRPLFDRAFDELFSRPTLATEPGPANDAPAKDDDDEPGTAA
jgi:hypothetical protein